MKRRMSKAIKKNREPGTRLRAIDLYSGIGGWSLGLKLAGLNVVASYEHWGAANETNFKNNKHQALTLDIRRLSLDELPKKIDIVVGSPPCTQFSFANRGGTGDIADGLKDIIKFLTIVDHLKPTAWAMENVPRVAKIIKEELQPRGKLYRFRHLGIETHIVNMAAFGLPQKRLRCIAGNFNFRLLMQYSESARVAKLESVVAAMKSDPVIDPLFGLSLENSNLTDHVVEDFLNSEEVRINKANKVLHPVYNSMPFPDRLDRSVRTITATCTRVSRESIVIEDPMGSSNYRRLTIRERASLQGFPITFQFYGPSFSAKSKMVGNAVPPAFTYLMGNVFRNVSPLKIVDVSKRAKRLRLPTVLAIDSAPDKPGSRYPKDRTFRFAIPSLRLKSGVRFELVNCVSRNSVGWEVNFYFGTSKAIKKISLDFLLHRKLMNKMPEKVGKLVRTEVQALTAYIDNADVLNMQRIWCHRGVGMTQPFMLLDELHDKGARLVNILSAYPDTALELVTKAVKEEHGKKFADIAGFAKLGRNAPLILAGLLVGSLANYKLAQHDKWSLADKVAG